MYRLFACAILAAGTNRMRKGRRMSRVTEVAVIFGLFVLRLGIPLGVTVLISWGLRRLDRKWQSEAETQRIQAGAPVTAGEPETAPRQPCWLFRNCPEERRLGCPAYSDQRLPCWLARLRAEGRLPALCPDCDLFRTSSSSRPAVA